MGLSVCDRIPRQAHFHMCSLQSTKEVLQRDPQLLNILHATPFSELGAPDLSGVRQELASLGAAAVRVASAAAARGACGGPHLWAAAGALRVLHLLVERGAMGVPAKLLPRLHVLQAHPEVCLGRGMLLLSTAA